MHGKDTDLEWERLGAVDPYFGVITDPRFHRANLTNALRDEFFASGRVHVAHVYDVIRRHVSPGFAPRRVLDFGCGVGRLLIPFAATADTVVGTDVSPSMLAEAERNCRERGVDVRLVRSDDTLSGLDDTFDLVHSFIVFQHIPVARGMAILDRLLERIAPGGVGALHFLYGFDTTVGRIGRLLKTWLPGSRYLINAARGRALTTPVMQMNPYDLETIFTRIHARGARSTYVEHTNHGGALGAHLFFAVR
jgi:SAM-dependent methyltransferase